MTAAPPPSLVLLIGVQASGKSTFCRERFYDSHVRINLDMLRTRYREAAILDACMRFGQPMVIDNTNVTRAERARYIAPARDAGYTVTGYYFQSGIEACKARNEQRPESSRIPLPGLLGTHSRLELPAPQEGFDNLHYVTIDPAGGFIVEEWRHEV